MVKRAFLITYLLTLMCQRSGVEKAEAFLKKGKLKEAESILLYLKQKGNPPPKVYLLLGEIYLTQGEYYKSIREFKSIPQKSLFREELGKDLHFLFKKTKTKAKEIAFQSADLMFTLNPALRDQEVLKYLADAYIERGKKIEAISALEKLSSSLNIEILEKLFNLYLATGNEKKVLLWWNKIPDTLTTDMIKALSGKAFFKTGMDLFKHEKYDSAGIYFNKMVNIGAPLVKLPEAYLYIGKIKVFQGDTSGALRSFREVLKLNPSKETGIPQEARKYINELIE